MQKSVALHCTLKCWTRLPNDDTHQCRCRKVLWASTCFHSNAEWTCQIRDPVYRAAGQHTAQTRDLVQEPCDWLSNCRRLTQERGEIDQSSLLSTSSHAIDCDHVTFELNYGSQQYYSEVEREASSVVLQRCVPWWQPSIWTASLETMPRIYTLPSSTCRSAQDVQARLHTALYTPHWQTFRQIVRQIKWGTDQGTDRQVHRDIPWPKACLWQSCGSRASGTDPEAPVRGN